MSLTAGTRLGPYEITGKLGEGGMGEVYRATDTKLRREVAIKVLPAAFTEDRERLARFEREAQMLAQLHHPNIASIFGLEESGGARALVMELVEGPTLAERLEAGPMSLAESLSFARQIAEALEEAHEKGIVHRDLKPQNIKASIEGKLKVLDFGLAKAMDAGSAAGMSPHDLAHSPTMTIGGTREGMILGTAAYMSPEQARGSAVDKRADVWAFGVVLYEMLTGERLFAEGSVVDTLSAVMRKEIDLGRLPQTTPPRLRELVRHCLERNPRDRLRDIGDARIVLAEIASGRGEELVRESAPFAAPIKKLSRPGLALAAALAALALGWLAGRTFGPGAGTARSAETYRFRQLTQEPGGEREPSLAPDGESFVYAKRINGQYDLFLQRVNGSKPTNLTPECALDDLGPAFSPDGRKIAYRSDCGGGGIFVMGATGESARRVTDAGHSPSWSPDGRELALTDTWTDDPSNLPGTSTMWAVDIESGARRLLSRHDAHSPAWSPNGKRVAFFGYPKESFQRDLWTVAADGSQAEAAAAVAVVDDLDLDFAPTWSPDGHFLLFASSRGGSMNLWRIAIDESSGKARGLPAPLVVPSGWAGWPTISRDGRRFLFVDRNARTTIMRAPLDPVRRQLAGPPVPVFQGSFEIREQELSPDGALILFSNLGTPANLHLTHADGTGYRQLTDGLRDRQAHWSPDGSTIAFQTMRWPGGLGMVGVDGSALRPVDSGSATGIWEPIWSPDGKWMATNDNEQSYLIDARGAKLGRKEIPRACEECLFRASDWATRGGFLLGTVIRSGAFLRYATFELESGKFSPELRADGGAGGGALVDQYPKLLPDERSYLGAEGNRIVVHELDGRPPRELLRLGEGARVGRLSLSRDGRWLTFIERTDESDIWLATRDDGAQQH